MDKRTAVASLLIIADKLDEIKLQEYITYSNTLTRIAEEIAEEISQIPFDGEDLGTDNSTNVGLNLGSGMDLNIGQDLDIGEKVQFPAEQISELDATPEMNAVASIKLRKKLRF